MKRCRIFGLCILMLSVPVFSSAAAGLVIVGAGSAGNWETWFDLSNPYSGVLSADLLLDEFPESKVCTGLGPLFHCYYPVLTLTLDPFSSIETRISALPTYPLGEPVQLHTVFVVPSGSESSSSSTNDLVPVVRASQRNRVTGAEEALPVYSALAVLERGRPRELDFPGVTCDGEHRCDLTVESITDQNRAVESCIRVEAYAPDGILLSHWDFGICDSPGVAENFFLSDLSGRYGLTVSGGFLRVTQIGGDGTTLGNLVVTSRSGSGKILRGIVD